MDKIHTSNLSKHKESIEVEQTINELYTQYTKGISPFIIEEKPPKDSSYVLLILNCPNNFYEEYHNKSIIDAEIKHNFLTRVKSNGDNYNCGEKSKFENNVVLSYFGIENADLNINQ